MVSENGGLELVHPLSSRKFSLIMGFNAIRNRPATLVLI